MATLLLAYCGRDKILVIPNWMGMDSLPRIEKMENPFILKHDLLHKFVVMYSGNIGFTHNVASIIEIQKPLEKMMILFSHHWGRIEKG